MTHIHLLVGKTSLLALALAMCEAPMALAQQMERARDLDPAIVSERKQARTAAPLTFGGAAGYFDYVVPIAALPDGARGALPPLFAFKAGGEEPLDALRPYQTRGRRVDVNWDELDRLEPDKQYRMRARLFDGEEYELAFIRCEWRDKARWTWFGQIAGVAASDFVLVRQDDAVDLVISNYNDRRYFQLQFVQAFGQQQAGHALRKRGDILPSDAEKWCAPSNEIDRLKAVGTGGTAGAAAAVATKATMDVDGAPEPPTDERALLSVSDPTNVVDVMFVCTSQARDGYGGNFNAFLAEAEQCISQMNIRLSNSQVGLTMRLMSADWTLAASYNEAASGTTDLANLAGDFNAPNSAAFAATRAAAADRRADLVTLIRQAAWNISGNGGTVGVARMSTVNSQLNDPQSGTQYSVNSRSGLLPLAAEVFPHELGHNMGACHEAEQNDCTTSFPMAHGKRFNCFGNFCWDAWNTIMAYHYPDNCASPFTTLSEAVPFYSNPNLHLGGAICNPAMGDAESYDANVINTNRSLVSQRRIASTQRWVNVLGGGYNDPTSGGGFQYPHSRVAVGVANVQGGVASGVVRVVGYGQANPYNETAANGGQPVTLSNPCVIAKWGVPNEGVIVLK